MGSGIHFDSDAGIDKLRKETLAAMQSEIDQLKGQLTECRVRLCVWGGVDGCVGACMHVCMRVFSPFCMLLTVVVWLKICTIFGEVHAICVYVAFVSNISVPHSHTHPVCTCKAWRSHKQWAHHSCEPHRGRAEHGSHCCQYRHRLTTMT